MSDKVDLTAVNIGRLRNVEAREIAVAYGKDADEADCMKRGELLAFLMDCRDRASDDQAEAAKPASSRRKSAPPAASRAALAPVPSASSSRKRKSTAAPSHPPAARRSRATSSSRRRSEGVARRARPARAVAAMEEDDEDEAPAPKAAKPKRQRRAQPAAAHPPVQRTKSFEELLASERENAAADPNLDRVVSEYQVRKEFTARKEDGTWAARAGLRAALKKAGVEDTAAPGLAAAAARTAANDPKLASFVDGYLEARRKREAVLEVIGELVRQGRRRTAASVLRAMAHGTVEIEEEEFEYEDDAVEA